ncbi:MAG: hypothetical protein JWO28_3336 [Hyphomicrobiales bacterium]|nr:hypothetical protein [Hyphomicrobiales bacterium]
MNAPSKTTPATFEAFWRLGYRRLVPVIPPIAEISERSSLFKRIGTSQDGRGKTPGVRGSDGKWHSFDWTRHESDELDCQRYQRMGAGIGVKMGQGLYFIDADTLDKILAGIIQMTAVKHFGVLCARIGRFPKAGYPIRVSSPIKYMRIDFGDGERVEILGEGRQAVFAGVHPKTNLPYVWPIALKPFDELPIFSPAQVVAFLEELRTLLPAAKPVITEGATTDISQASLRGSIETVRKAVAATPNTSAAFPTRESYRDYGYAIKASLPDDEPTAFEIFAEWCGRWTDGTNDPDIVAADWRRMKPPYRRGAGWIYELAEQHAPDQFKKIDVYFDVIAEPKESLVTGYAGIFGLSPPLAPAAVEFSEPLDIFGDADPAELSDPQAGSLPPLIERWARSEARRKGVPYIFAAAAAIGVASSAVGSSLRISPRVHDDGWLEPAALWLALVADPGSAKSPIISAAVEPLRRLDSERGKADQAKHDAWAAASKKKGKDHPDPGREPIVRRSVVDDVTMERQVRIHADNPRGLLRAPDELFGLFGSLGAYKKGADGDRSQVLRLFEGKEVIVDRVGAGSIRADKALMGIIAGTQPEKLKTLVRDLSNDGMLQRFIFILHDGKERQGIDEAPDRDALASYARAIKGLASAEYAYCPPIKLSADGYAALAEMTRQTASLKSIPATAAAWRGHVEKWGKFLPRLILTFHALEEFSDLGAVDPEKEVSLATVRRAISFARFLLIRHGLRFYETYFGASEAANEAREIAGFVLSKGASLAELTRKTVYDARKDLRGPRNLPILLAAMAELENADWCSVTARQADGPTRWRVNPMVHDRFDERAARERTNRAERQRRIVEAGKQRQEWSRMDSETENEAETGFEGSK